MKDKIKEILKKFEEIEDIWSQVPMLQRTKFDKIVYNEGKTISQCARWGLSSCDNILEELKKDDLVTIKNGKENLGMGDN